MESKMSTAAVSESLLGNQVSKIETWIESNEKLDQILTQIEEKIKVKKAYIAIASAIFLALWLGSGHAGQLICNLIGVLYPSYASIKAIGK